MPRSGKSAPQNLEQTTTIGFEATLGPVYDPSFGSGSMFVSSEKFIKARSGKIGDISIYGQGPTTPPGS